MKPGRLRCCLVALIRLSKTFFWKQIFVLQKAFFTNCCSDPVARRTCKRTILLLPKDSCSLTQWIQTNAAFCSKLLKTKSLCSMKTLNSAKFQHQMVWVISPVQLWGKKSEMTWRKMGPMTWILLKNNAILSVQWSIENRINQSEGWCLISPV